MKKKNKKNAFTLVELLAVITILGVIGFIIIPIIDNAKDKANTARMELQEDLLELSGKDYFLSNRAELPKSLSEESTVSLETLINSGYIEKIYDYNEGECSASDSYVTAVNTSVGEYQYAVYLSCDNYVTAGDWGDWGPWQVEPITPSATVQVQSAILYNYKSTIGVWEDTSDWAYNKSNVVPIELEGDTRTVYRYNDIEAKWYAKDYNPTYYSTSPTGYPYKDEGQTQFTTATAWSTTQPTSYSYRTISTQQVYIAGSLRKCRTSSNTTCYGCGTANMLPATTSFYPASLAPNPTYSYSAGYRLWHCNPIGSYSCSGSYDYIYTSTPSCPVGTEAKYGTFYNFYKTTERILQTQYSYVDQKWLWYDKDYYQDGGVDGYSLTAPAGYENKDETETNELGWVYTSGGVVITTAPTSYDYRTIQSKGQIYTMLLGDEPVFENYVLEVDFASEHSEGMTIQEVEADTDYELLDQVMYRSRIRQ